MNIEIYSKCVPMGYKELFDILFTQSVRLVVLECEKMAELKDY